MSVTTQYVIAAVLTVLVLAGTVMMAYFSRRARKYWQDGVNQRAALAEEYVYLEDERRQLESLRLEFGSGRETA